MQLIGVISGREQGLLRCYHFVDAAICNQIETMHVDKQLKNDQLKELIAMYDC